MFVFSASSFGLIFLAEPCPAKVPGHCTDVELLPCLTGHFVSFKRPEILSSTSQYILSLSSVHPTMTLQLLLSGLTLNIVLLGQQSDFLLSSKSGFNSIKYEILYYLAKWANGFPGLL